MRYFCITHQPIPWPVPRFMEPVSTVPVGEGVLDLGQRYPGLAGRGRELGEYATLFALRRMLQESWNGEAPPEWEMVGVSQYRRFMTTRSIGRPYSGYGVITPEILGKLARDTFLPPSGTVLMSAPALLGDPVVTQYGFTHHMRDLLRFMAIAIDLGVVDGEQAGAYLGQETMVIAPSVGVYPARWLVEVLEGLEKVVDVFASTVAVERDGYQRRAVGFCCERLHSLLANCLAMSWPRGRLLQARPALVSQEARSAAGR